MTTSLRSPAPEASASASTAGRAVSQPARASRHRSGKPLRGPSPDESLVCEQVPSACVALIGTRGIRGRVSIGVPRSSSIPAGSESFDTTDLLQLDVSELKDCVDLFDSLCNDAGEDVEPRSAEEWAAEFLHLPLPQAAEDVERYFASALRNAYARRGDVWTKLVLTAAAYALKLREENPAYALPGTLRHSLATMTRPQQEALLSRTASYQEHSYAVENAPLSRHDVALDLHTLLPQG